ncbi:hypothetical protein MRX96_023252 [Rhipicephalus microplus]
MCISQAVSPGKPESTTIGEIGNYSSTSFLLGPGQSLSACSEYPADASDHVLSRALEGLWQSAEYLESSTDNLTGLRITTGKPTCPTSLM